MKFELPEARPAISAAQTEILFKEVGPPSRKTMQKICYTFAPSRFGGKSGLEGNRLSPKFSKEEASLKEEEGESL